MKRKMQLKHTQFEGLLAFAMLAVLLLSKGCVEDYNPNLSEQENILVINGSILRGAEEQSIFVSRSTSVNNLEYIEVGGCDVYVRDDKNNVFQFEEMSPGRYTATIDQSYLEIGAKFKLSVETPDSQVYESSYEEIHDSPSIDSMYFIGDSEYSIERGMNLEGQRLNLDLYANEEYTGYYRWKIHETWETRASNAKIDKILVGVDTFITTYRWDTLNSEWIRGRAIPVPEFDYLNKPDTFHICYLDSEVEEIFLSNTSTIVANTRKRVPLHFIPNIPRLSFRYSCLVSQYVLSEDAYNYYQTKVSEIRESGQIYYSQPSQNLSNLKNINSEEETVLGYFWASTVRQKRIFFEGPYVGRAGCGTAMLFDVNNFYEQNPFGKYGEFRFISTMYSPVYIINENTYPPNCFDCRYSGGTLERPDFW